MSVHGVCECVRQVCMHTYYKSASLITVSMAVHTYVLTE